MLAPLGKYTVYISGLLLRMCKFCGLASKLVLENIFSHASTRFYLALNETLQNIQFFKPRADESWNRAKVSF